MGRNRSDWVGRRADELVAQGMRRRDAVASARTQGIVRFLPVLRIDDRIVLEVDAHPIGHEDPTEIHLVDRVDGLGGRPACPPLTPAASAGERPGRFAEFSRSVEEDYERRWADAPMSVRSMPVWAARTRCGMGWSSAIDDQSFDGKKAYHCNPCCDGQEPQFHDFREPSVKKAVALAGDAAVSAHLVGLTLMADYDAAVYLLLERIGDSTVQGVELWVEAVTDGLSRLGNDQVDEVARAAGEEAAKAVRGSVWWEALHDLRWWATEPGAMDVRTVEMSERRLRLVEELIRFDPHEDSTHGNVDAERSFDRAWDMLWQLKSDLPWALGLTARVRRSLRGTSG